MLERTIGQPQVPANFSETSFVEDNSVGGAFDKGNEGAQLFSHLSDAIGKYNASKAAGEQIPDSRLQEGGISNCNNFVMLDYLVQAQLFIAQSSQTAMK